MRKGMMMVGVLVVLGILTSAQGALISGDTLDRMHWDSPTTLWYEHSGNYATQYDSDDLTNDPNDDESPQVILTRGDGTLTSFGYKTEAGKTFSTVQVATATAGPIYSSDGSERIILSWEANGGGLTNVAPTLLSYIGPTSGGWQQYVFCYDLSGLNADRIRITITDWRDYSPCFSSVKLGVVPEPASLLLVIFGGLSAICRRKR